MKNSIKLVFVSLVGFACGACNSYDFEQEQCRNEINLLSNSDMVYDRQVSKLQPGGDTIYLVAGLSGSQLSNKAFNVALKEADSLFNAYNKSNFDIETHRYARFLPEACFSFPDLQMQIPAGQSQVRFPIYLNNLDKLSPDSIYFLNYKIDSLKTDAYNPKKKEVLLRIFKQNEFATTKTNTFYNYTSSYITTLSQNPGTPRRPTSSNQVFPLGIDSVRMLAGDENFGDYKNALNNINRMSIKVIVGEKTPENPLARFVTVEPYRTIDVVQLPPSETYNNTYIINVISTPDGRSTYYKEFRLHYKYRMEPSQPYQEVKAILRMEYNPRADLL